MGGQCGVGRGEHDLAPPRRLKVLTVRLVVGDPGHHDVAVVGVGLLADDHVVAVEDAGVDHRLPPDPQHEDRARAGEVLGQREQLLDVLAGEHPGAGGHVADQRDVADRAGPPSAALEEGS